MITLFLTTPTASSSRLLALKPARFQPKLNNRTNLFVKRKIEFNKGICRAEFSTDAPFAAAIGASILSSLFLPKAVNPDEDGDAAIDSTDTRLIAMTVISFIPYFNWLGWIFAWLDTGKRRYAVYALVYLAPYIRSNMSLSPEDSWLPIASILLGIFHVQLEASIKNGDINGFQFLKTAANYFSPEMKKKDLGKKDGKKELNLKEKDHQEYERKESNLEEKDHQVPNKSEKHEHREQENGDIDGFEMSKDVDKFFSTMKDQGLDEFDSLNKEELDSIFKSVSNIFGPMIEKFEYDHKGLSKEERQEPGRQPSAKQRLKNEIQKERSNHPEHLHDVEEERKNQ